MTTPCGCCAAGLTRCTTGGNPVQGMLCGDQVIWFDSAGNPVDEGDLIDCDLSTDPCAPPFVAANDVPWTVAADGLSAVKVVNGVTITGRVVGTSLPGTGFFHTGCGGGACDPNAVRVSNTTQGWVDVEFDADHAQPFTTVRIIDMDDLPGAADAEQAIFQAPHNVNADVNTPLNAIPGGLPGGIIYRGDLGPGIWRAPNTTNERSGELTWNAIGWGGGNPIRVRYQMVGGLPPGQSGRSSMYDFGGEVLREECQ